MSDAINQANLTPATTDIICLTPNATYTLTQIVASSSGLPTITTPITIRGNNALIQRGGSAPTMRLLNNSTGTLTLEALRLSGGSPALYSQSVATVNASIFSGNPGGGISNVQGMLTVSESTFSGNTASVGAGVYTSGLVAVTTINSSTFSSNTASSAGGAIFTIDGRATISDTIITGNSAATGGGIYNGWFSTTTTITATVFSSNTGTTDGGALATDSGGLVVSQSCFSGNTSPGVDVLVNTVTTASADARNNWWGRTTGPVTGEVSAFVLVNPYLMVKPGYCP